MGGNKAKQKKPILAFAFTAILGVFSASNINQVIASSGTQNVNFNANVNSNCSLQSPVAIAFGSYDPVVTNATNPLDANGSFDIKCNKGGTAILSINGGLNPAGINRRMTDGSSNYLTYNLYTTTGRSTVWNASNTVSYTAANGGAFTEIVYGRIPGGQSSAVVGSYSDTVVVTATY